MVKFSSYKKKIQQEGLAFDKQVHSRHKKGLIPDLRRLKKKIIIFIITHGEIQNFLKFNGWE